MYDEFHRDVFVTGMRDLSARDLSRYKRAFQIDPKPLAELAMVRERSPDTRDWSLELNALLDSAFRHKQPPGCILDGRAKKRNYLVALS